MTEIKTSTKGVARRSRNAAYEGRYMRRRGVTTVLVAVGMVAIMGATALSFDLSRLYTVKASAQKAADAAALAGAYGAGTSDGQGQAYAAQYANANGFGPAMPRVTMQAGPDAEGNYRVTLSRPERAYFAQILTGRRYENITVTAAAAYTRPVAVPLQNYGIEGGATSLSVFGADALASNGDIISPKYMDDGKGNNLGPNPYYNGKGFDFNVTPTGGAANYKKLFNTSKVQVEIFDPGFQRGTGYDETQDQGWSDDHGVTTKYTVYYDDGLGNSTEVATKTYGDAGPDMAWDNPFTFDLDDPRFASGGTFRLNVTSLSGTAENGFNLRAGPPYSKTDVPDSSKWSQLYGNAVGMSARNNIPINFMTDGEVKINLGHVPELPNGGSVTIDKWDLDVGSKSVLYTDGTGAQRQGALMPGTQADRNGVWAPQDKFTFTKADKYPGGDWVATYTAGKGDTSIWKMGYTGEGNLILVR